MRFDLDQAGRDAIASDIEPAPRPETGLLRVRVESDHMRAALNDRSLRSLDTGKLRAEIASLCRQGHPRVILLSMRSTETLASSVLGSLAQLSADLERVGGVLVLYKVPKEVTKVMKKTRLDRLIHISKDRPGALKKARGLTKKSTPQRRSNAA